MKNALFTLAMFNVILACTSKPAENDTPDSSNNYMIARQIGYNGIEGGACKVIAGPNEGKTGTYDSEGACCNEATWGCTECGTGKCEDACGIKLPGLAIEGHQVSIVSGNYTDNNGGFVHCINLMNDSTGIVERTICFPLVIETINALRSSSQDQDNKMAEAIAPYIKQTRR